MLQSAGMLGVPTSRPLSMATNVSVELSGYQRALEDVLTWLLEAEDRLTNAPPTTGTLHQIKEQFHTHEVIFFCYIMHFHPVIIFQILMMFSVFRNFFWSWHVIKMV